MSMKVDNIQIALFTKPGAPQSDALQIWNSSCKGVLPDNFQRGNNTPLSVSYVDGTSGGYKLQVQSRLGRIDIFMFASPIEGVIFPPAQISNIKDALRIIEGIASNTMNSVKPVRIALVCNMAEFFDNIDSVIDKLEAEINGVSFPRNSSDHIYQYNIPSIASENEAMVLNRIVTYGSGTLQQISGTISPMGSNMSVSNEKVALTLKIDINSLPNQDVSQIATELLPNVFSQMNAMIEDGANSIL